MNPLPDDNKRSKTPAGRQPAAGTGTPPGGEVDHQDDLDAEGAEARSAERGKVKRRPNDKGSPDGSKQDTESRDAGE